MRAVEGKLDNKLFFDLADWSEPVRGVGAHPFVERTQLVIREA